jgi:hypothetical protein
MDVSFQALMGFQVCMGESVSGGDRGALGFDGMCHVLMGCPIF